MELIDKNSKMKVISFQKEEIEGYNAEKNLLKLKNGVIISRGASCLCDEDGDFYRAHSSQKWEKDNGSLKAVDFADAPILKYSYDEKEVKKLFAGFNEDDVDLIGMF